MKESIRAGNSPQGETPRIRDSCGKETHLACGERTGEIGRRILFLDVVASYCHSTSDGRGSQDTSI